jgi:hypothetical protein
MAPNDSDRRRPRAHLFSDRLLQITIPDHLDEQEHSTVLRRQRSLRHAVSAISAEPESIWILTVAETLLKRWIQPSDLLQAATLSSHTGRIITVRCAKQIPIRLAPSLRGAPCATKQSRPIERSAARDCFAVARNDILLVVRSMCQRVGAELEFDDERARQRLRRSPRRAGGRRVDAFDVERCAVARSHP